MSLPRHLELGNVGVEAWRAWALAGVVAATMTFVVLAAATGGSLWLAFGLVPLLLAGFVLASLARRRLLGRETTVLLEHLALALAVASAVTWAAGEDVVRWLDRLVPALAVLFACGRVGCTSAGCCYGVRSNVGLGPAERRRFPTQPIEAAAWLVLGASGSVVAVSGQRGAAAAGILGAYAVLRFALEGVRGDRRPHWLGLSESRWLSIAALALALALGPRPSAGGALVAAAGLVALGALWVTREDWLVAPRPVPDDSELIRWGRRLRAHPPSGDSVLTLRHDELSLAASRHAGGLVISLRSPGPVDPHPVFSALAAGLGTSLPNIEEPRPRMFAAAFPFEAPSGPARSSDYFGAR